MPAGDNGPRRYQVHASAVIGRSLRRIQRHAAGEGRGEETLAAIREIHERLQRKPFEAGEPVYRLPVLRMQVRTITVRPLVVDFAVCEDRPLVFIKGVKLLSAPRR